MNRLIKTAFTLIELLVVIAIIGILSGLIVVTMNGVTGKANIAKGQVFSNSLRNALMLNLVSEWKFNENTGTSTVDSWSGGNNCTLVGTSHVPTWKTGTDCIRGSCVQFDGIDDYATCGTGSNLNITGPMTLEAWVKVLSWSGSNSYAVVAENYQTTTGGYLIERENANNNLFFGLWRVSGGFMTAIPTGTLAENTWYHVTGVFNSTYMTFYVNGVLKGDSGTFASTTIASSANPFIMGGRSASCKLNAIIDEVRVYNAALPTSQIKEQYYVGLNSLYSNGEMTKEEYLSGINELVYED